jgi:Ca2+-dependent lipid-binding protein
MYSQVVNESLNPVWNQTFDFVVEDGLHDMLIIELWDHDTFGKVTYFKFVCLKVVYSMS